MAFCAWQYRPMRIAQNYLQKKKGGDVLDNQQNLVDCRRKQCWLPKRRAILNIGRDKIQTILCVCARACAYTFDSTLRRLIDCHISGLIQYIPEVPASSLSLDSNSPDCWFSWFSPVCWCRRWDTLTSISSLPLASTPYQLFNHHSPAIRLYTTWRTSSVAKWATNKPKCIKITIFYYKYTWKDVSKDTRCGSS